VIFSVERSRWVLLEQCLLERREVKVNPQSGCQEHLRTGIVHDRGSEVHSDYVVRLLVRELRGILIDLALKGANGTLSPLNESGFGSAMEVEIRLSRAD
jgi:hypothetical protein